jgi:hypothetical protein
LLIVTADLPTVSSVVLNVSRNNNTDLIDQIEFQTCSTNTNEIDTISRTGLFQLNQGDDIRVLIRFGGNLDVRSPTLVITKIDDL